MRNYKSKNCHTKPSKSGVKNMSKAFDESHKDKDDDELMGNLSEMFKVGVEKAKRTSAWTEEDLAREISGYFDYCVLKGLKPCKAGIRTYLAISRAQYYSWQSDSARFGVITDLINMANDVMEQEYIGRSEKYPTSNLFLLRTSHGHVETSKLDVNATGMAITSADEVKDLVDKLGLDKK